MLLRGTVVTMAEGDSRDGSALSIEGDRVGRVWFGDDSVRKAEGEAGWDVGGRVILPGFLDGHTHAEVGAVALIGPDCRAPRCSSISDVQDSLRDALDRADARGGWLVGQGNLFLDQKLAEKRLPNRDDLDAVSRDMPIVIQAGGHASCVNSKVIELRGLDDFHPEHTNMGDPVIERDSSGRPTGIVGEMDKFLDIPSPSESVLHEALRHGIQEIYTSRGVTTLTEITETRVGVQALDALLTSGDVGPRVSLAVWAPGTVSMEEALDWRAHPPFASPPDRLTIQGVKIFTDGGFSARTAAMLTPYVDECGHSLGFHGGMALSEQDIKNQLSVILDGGLQPIVHTCGELATRKLCEVVIQLGATGSDVRAEHVGNFLVDALGTIELLKEAGVRPMPNPAFIHAIGASLPSYIGDVALGSRFPFRTMMDSGFRLSGSSDVHVGAHPRGGDPLFLMWCSAARKGFDGTPVDSEQAVTVDEALRMQTLYAAEALGVADRRGTLEHGKDADIVVLSRDPRSVSNPDELLDITVDFVFVGGRCVYERPGAEPLRPVA
ncbi:MAG: amidohydrolase family protein [Actinomycetota bacterium]|nr:amidohydrolase family protein [Actinomycetota bacterium]